MRLSDYAGTHDTMLVCKLCDEVIGPDYEDNMQLYFGKDSVICHSCVTKMIGIHKSMVSMGILPDGDGEFRDFHKNTKALKPRDIKVMLDKNVVGQEKAKRALSVAAYNHYKRVNVPEVEIEKSNILLVGPTGSGKTYLIKKLAEILDLPLAIADATSLTESGYVGEDVESVLVSLLHAAGGDVTKAEKGIVFIDEIDKLATSNSAHRKEVGAKGVQQALLKLLEGTVCEVGLTAKNKHEQGISNPTVRMDTSNILFICGGAFPEVEDIIRKRLSTGGTSMGFGASVEKEEIEKDVMLNITLDDLRKFGMIPEFLGRLPVVVPLQDITVDMLKRILTEPKNAITKQYANLMDIDGINLIFDTDALEAIAEKALKNGTGARALRAVMEEVMEEIMFDAPSEKDIAVINITKGYVLGTEKYSYKTRNDLRITYRL